MASLAIGVRFTPVSAGSGDFVYSGAVTGYTNPTGLTDGKTYRYRAESSDLSEWEWGSGAWTAGTSTLARTTVLLSSNANSKVTFSAQPQVSIVIFPADVIQFDDAMSLTAAQQAQAMTNIGVVPNCGQLQFVSSTSIKLMPLYGDLLKIAGVLYKIPSAGVSSGAPTSCFLNGTAAQTLAVNTLYYVYAFNNSGTLALDFSTTGHATDTTAGNVGIEIKSGDSSRSLIGMTRTGATVIFVNSVTQRYVRSWLNSFGVDLTGTVTTATTASASLVEVDASARVQFIVWAGEIADFCCQGTMTDSTGSNSMAAAVGIDGATTASQEVAGNNFATGARVPFCSRFSSSSLAEGLHFATPLLRSVGGGTAGFTGSGALVTGRVGR